MTNQNTALPTSLPEELAARIFKARESSERLDWQESIGSISDHGTGWILAYHETLPIIDALENHIRQQEATIKTLEMQGKWLSKVIEAQERLSACYRLRKQPPEWVFKTLDKHRKNKEGV